MDGCHEQRAKCRNGRQPMEIQLTDTVTKGRRAENDAAAMLRARGYSIIARNYRVHRMGELDLVASRGRVLLFVEVKSSIVHPSRLRVDGTQRPAPIFHPLGRISGLKRKRLMMTASHFIWKHDLEDHFCDLAAISLIYDTQGRMLDHQLVPLN